MLRVADQMSRTRLLATAQRESGAWLNALPVSSHGTLLDSKSFTVVIAAGGWTVGVWMACPANTVLAAFQGIRQ